MTRYIIISLYGIIILIFSCGSSNNLQIDPHDPSTPIGDNSAQSKGGIHGDPETAIFNILFVGNSLTYYNDLPKLVYELAKTKEKYISTKMIAKPNYAIIDHLDIGNEVNKEIESKQYDYVIVQQGPSSQNEGRRLLLEGGKRFEKLCNENDSELVFFMVWPSLTYYQNFDGVIANYKEAATLCNSLLAPVGSAWKQYFDDTKDFSYYGPDGFHPSLEGSKVTAQVILETLGI
ncbi:MAG: hypothetical protein V3V00_10655 [Saprospiraceae bacterium]